MTASCKSPAWFATRHLALGLSLMIAGCEASLSETETMVLSATLEAELASIAGDVAVGVFPWVTVVPAPCGDIILCKESLDRTDEGWLSRVDLPPDLIAQLVRRSQSTQRTRLTLEKVDGEYTVIPDAVADSLMAPSGQWARSNRRRDGQFGLELRFAGRPILSGSGDTALVYVFTDDGWGAGGALWLLTLDNCEWSVDRNIEVWSIN